MPNVGELSIPKMVLPTGYEAQQQELMNRMQIAQALREKALAGPGQNVTSYLQPIASLVQALAARHMDKQNHEDYANLTHSMMGSYQNARQGFVDDVHKGVSDQDLLLKYGTNPYVQELLAPYKAGASKGRELGQEQSPTDFIDIDPTTGRAVRTTKLLSKTGQVGNFANGTLSTPTEMKNVNGIFLDPALQSGGSMAPNDPNSRVMRNPDGSFGFNKPQIFGEQTGRTGGQPPPGVGGQPDPVTQALMSSGGYAPMGSPPSAPVMPPMPPSTTPSGNPLSPAQPQIRQPMAPMQPITQQGPGTDSFDQTAAQIMSNAKLTGKISPMDMTALQQHLGPQGAQALQGWVRQNNILTGN